MYSAPAQLILHFEKFKIRTDYNFTIISHKTRQHSSPISLPSKTKLIISAGCSFTQFPSGHKTWPYHLSRAMGIEALYLGHGAGSNGIISKKTIFNTLETLKNYNPKDILVGIMWSGCHRDEYYFDRDPGKFHKMGYRDNDSNPLRIVSDSNYYLVNDHWDDPLSSSFYNNFF